VHDWGDPLRLSGRSEEHQEGSTKRDKRNARFTNPLKPSQ